MLSVLKSNLTLNQHIKRKLELDAANMASQEFEPRPDWTKI